jgi:hypothetical protein
MCPYLVPVVADRMFVYPQGLFCRRPNAGVRIPARATLLGVCTTDAFADCAGYRDSAMSELVGSPTRER